MISLGSPLRVNIDLSFLFLLPLPLPPLLRPLHHIKRTIHIRMNERHRQDHPSVLPIPAPPLEQRPALLIPVLWVRVGRPKSGQRAEWFEAIDGVERITWRDEGVGREVPKGESVVQTGDGRAEGRGAKDAGFGAVLEDTTG